MKEQKRKQQRLEEQYSLEKRKLQQQQETLNNQLNCFQKETEQLIDKVNHLTKHETWNKLSFYHAMEHSNKVVRQAGNHYAQHLEETERTLTKNYQKEREQLQET